MIDHVDVRCSDLAASFSRAGGGGGPVLLDPDGNGVAAVVHPEAGAPGEIDGLRLVGDLAAARRFYAAIGPSCGLRVAEAGPDRVRLDCAGSWLELVAGAAGEATDGLHLAFRVPSRAAVDAFHAAALAAGAGDNGAPGERPEHHPGYSGAFVLDPDGANVEAVHR